MARIKLRHYRFLAAHLVWFEGAWQGEARARFFDALPLVAFAQMVALAAARLYRGSYRYTAIPDLLVMLRALALAVGAGWVAHWIALGAAPSFGVTVLDAYFLATFVIGLRVSFRVLDYLFKHEQMSGRRVLVYGAGNLGVLALREIANNPALGMRVVGFVDDDAQKHRRIIAGCTVFAPHALRELIEARAFDELVVSTPKLADTRLAPLAERCLLAGIPVRRFSIAWELVSIAAGEAPGARSATERGAAAAHPADEGSASETPSQA